MYRHTLVPRSTISPTHRFLQASEKVPSLLAHACMNTLHGAQNLAYKMRCMFERAATSLLIAS